MDKEARTKFDKKIQDRMLLEQRTHIMRLENLEKEYGLDLDVYTDVYGEGSLNGGNESATRLALNWVELFVALKSDNRFTVIVRTRKELKPGCYGYGQEEQYDTKAEVLVIRGQAHVGAVKTDNETAFNITGPEIFRLSDGLFVRVADETLASSQDYNRQSLVDGSYKENRLLDADSEILSVDDFGKLYADFDFFGNGNAHFQLGMYNALNKLELELNT